MLTRRARWSSCWAGWPGARSSGRGPRPPERGARNRRTNRLLAVADEGDRRSSTAPGPGDEQAHERLAQVLRLVGDYWSLWVVVAGLVPTRAGADARPPNPRRSGRPPLLVIGPIR